MRMPVIVQTPEDFDRRVAWQQAPPVEPSGLAAEGKGILTRSACVACHTIRGLYALSAGTSPTSGAHGLSPGATLPTTTDQVAAWIQDPAR